MSRMKLTWLSLILLIQTWGCLAQSQPFLERFLQTEGLKNAAVGISVERVADGSLLVGHNPSMALTPASVTKLIPTVIALAEKGSGYRYQTAIYYTGKISEGTLDGDILLIAGGDPCVGSRYFPQYPMMETVVASVAGAGIKTIRGNIRVIGAKAGTDIPGSWPWEDISNYYAALYLPFNYHDNMAILDFRSGVAGTNAKLLLVTPFQPHVKYISEVKASAHNADDAWIYGGPYCDTMRVKGTIPQNRSSFKIKGAMHNPAESFVHELTASLKKKNIRVEKQNTSAAAKTLLLTWQSPAVKEIVFHTNKASVNLFAEALGKLIGEDDFQTASLGWFKEKGIDASGVTLKDACGLSPLDAVPASVFTDLLRWADRNLGEDFKSSLPVAGSDGGLSGYCNGDASLQGKMMAKTGSFSGVRALSGYLTNCRGELLSFTILINHYTCSPVQLQEAVRLFLSRLAAF